MSNLKVVLKTLKTEFFAPGTPEVAGYVAVLNTGEVLPLALNVPDTNTDGTPALDGAGVQVVLAGVAVFPNVLVGGGSVVIYAVDASGANIGSGITGTYTIPSPDVARIVPATIEVIVQ
jgi:hypothetical protein